MLSYKRTLVSYIQTLKKREPVWFHEDLKQGKIKPIIAARIPLNNTAKVYELLERDR